MTKHSAGPPGRPRSPRPAKTAARPTRAQLQAMEARAAGAVVRPPATSDAPTVAPVALDFESIELPQDPAPTPTPVAVVMPPAAPGSTIATGGTRTRRRVAPQIVALSREQEYAYIRADMKRLLSIAGGLCAMMLVLLFVLGR